MKLNIATDATHATLTWRIPLNEDPNILVQRADGQGTPVLKGPMFKLAGEHDIGEPGGVPRLAQLTFGRPQPPAQTPTRYRGAVLPWKAEKRSGPRAELDAAVVRFEVSEKTAKEIIAANPTATKYDWLADWTPAQKSDLLLDAGRSMYGRWWWKRGSRAANDAHAAARIKPVIMCHRSDATLPAKDWAAQIHADMPEGTIIALLNEIGHTSNGKPYWTPGDWDSAVRYSVAVATELRKLGRTEIAAPCRSNPDAAAIEMDCAAINAIDSGKAFSWLNVHQYTDGSAGFIKRATDAMTAIRKACDDSGRKLLCDEFGCLASAVNVPAFEALCKVVLPLADVSCVWLLAPSKDQTSAYIVNADGTDSPFAAAWRGA